MTDFEFSFFIIPPLRSPSVIFRLAFPALRKREVPFFLLSFSPIGQKWDYFIGSLDSVMG